MILKCVFCDIKINENCMNVVNLMLWEIVCLNFKFYNFRGDFYIVNVMKFCLSVIYGFYVDNMLYWLIVRILVVYCILN